MSEDQWEDNQLQALSHCNILMSGEREGIIKGNGKGVSN